MKVKDTLNKKTLSMIVKYFFINKDTIKLMFFKNDIYVIFNFTKNLIEDNLKIIYTNLTHLFL